MAQFSGNHISQMHLFYELKQQYPNLTDKFVNQCIKMASGDLVACRGILEAEALIPFAMQQRRPSCLEVDESTKLVRYQTSHSAPTTPCSITRHAPQSIKRAIISPSSFLPDIRNNNGIEMLIKAQLERKYNMDRELNKEKNVLRAMQLQYEEHMALLASRKTSAKVQSLNDEIKQLSMECQRLVSELDASCENNDKTSSHRTDLLINGSETLTGREEDSQHWRCHICTFQNHRLLQQCDKCNMPQITLEGRDPQNIHIRVMHHKFPSCSGHILLQEKKLPKPTFATASAQWI
ncbi:uncharacterized protein LOC106667470 isoform X2 [Cimex lectularius]|uniref:RanBP2-type domain-containing protein n=1 Tax=Cimex lectularius TaxID=79782 RepID=A0A8I6TN30_CIMLE|nr:uncharacterized protein LOC106667470 isoform X2 [Cimex lectularius]